MPRTQQPDQHFPVRLTQAQRRVEKEWNRFEEMLGWMDDDFDSEAFDLDAGNHKLSKVR